LAFTEEKNNAKIENYTKSKILTVIFVFSLNSSLGKKVTGTQCQVNMSPKTVTIEILVARRPSMKFSEKTFHDDGGLSVDLKSS
jgi:hypothetical protein